MKNLFNSLIASSLRAEWPSSLLLLALLLVFVATAAGFLEFKSDFIPDIAVRGEVFSAPDRTFQLPLIVRSPDFAMMVVSGLVLAMMLPLLSPIGASLLVGLLAVPPFWLEVHDPYRANSVPMQFSLLVLLVLFGINVLLKYFVETQERQRLLAIFRQYVPPQIVGELGSRTKHLILDGESRFLTVLFCDLRNFTGLSEQLDPKDVVKLLNGYFTGMTGVLHRHGATIDKYIGDSIMAFWGAPLPQEDHVRHAVLASFEMHKEMQDLAALFHERGLPTPTIGIGINSGVMNVGNMGSHYRLTYTVIGDPVNLASRLQGTTREYGVSTIVGESTAIAYPDMIFRELDTVTVRGKTKGSHIFEPICLKSEVTPALTTKLARHDEVLKAYYSGDRANAERLIQGMMRDYAGDAYYPALLGKLLIQILPRSH
jgi:adenylate cyclase